MITAKHQQNASSVITKLRPSGFSLIEMVLVIILLGIMAVGVTSFISLSTQTYINVSERDEIIASARFTIERLNRELRNAVPNSVRVKNQSGINCVEFVPIVASTIYKDIPIFPQSTATSIKVIPFQNEDGSDYTCKETCDDVAIVYPLTVSDIFSDHSKNTGQAYGLKGISYTNSIEWTLTLDQPGVFINGSPTERIYIVNSPVSYCISNNKMYRFDDYSLNEAIYLTPFVFPNIMAENLADEDINNYPFTVLAATLQRNALIQIRLDFERSGEHYVFNNEVRLANSP